MKVFVVFVLLIGLSCPVFSQSISGFVKDKEGMPLPGASVFLSGTTFGDISDKYGAYSFKNLPYGIYTVVVTYVSFEKQEKTAEIYSDEKRTVNFFLEEKSIIKDTVSVTFCSWDELFKLFSDSFIGTSPESEDTDIINPEILVFREIDDSSCTRIEGNTKGFLEIRNKHLGYLLKIELIKFRIFDGVITFRGTMFFEELKTKERREKLFWKKNRMYAYKGSFRHFLASLTNDSLSENSFRMCHTKERHDYNQNCLGVISGEDAMNFMNPIVEDNLYSVIFPPMVKVIYRGQRNFKTVFDFSIIENKGGKVFVDTNGNFYDPENNLTIWGKWAYQGIWGLLPNNYKPE